MSVSRISGVAHNKHGEALIESVLSILIFGIMMLGITVMTNSSLNIINHTQANEAALQQTKNAASGNTASYTGTGTISLSITQGSGPSSINVFSKTGQDVMVYNEDNVIGFVLPTPSPSPTPDPGT